MVFTFCCGFVASWKMPASSLLFAIVSDHCIRWDRVHNFILALRILYNRCWFSFFHTKLGCLHRPKASKPFLFLSICLLFWNGWWLEFKGLIWSTFESIVWIFTVFRVGLCTFVKFPAFILILRRVLLLESIPANKRVEVAINLVTWTLTKRLTFMLVITMLLTALSGLTCVIARLALELVVVAVVTITKINQFLTTFTVVTFVLLELSRHAVVVFICLFGLIITFTVSLFRQTLLFVVGSF